MTTTTSARRLGTTPAHQRLRHSKSGSGRAGTLLTGILLLLFAVYFIAPLWWLLVSSTKTTNALYNSPMFWFSSEFSLFDNIAWISTAEGGVFWVWVLNSMLYSLVSAAVGTFIAAAAGYTLSKYQFRGRRMISAWVMGALMVPGAAMAIPTFLMMKEIGLLNSYAAVILPLLFSPFAVYFMTVYIKEAMPSELIDAGRIDGASDYRVFFQIGVPLIRPGLTTLFLISFVGAWNNFQLPLVMLTDTNLYPVTLGLQIWSANLTSAGSGEPLYPLILLGSLISIVPMLILFPIFRKYIVSGITLGSVKS